MYGTGQTFSHAEHLGRTRGDAHVPQGAFCNVMCCGCLTSPPQPPGAGTQEDVTEDNVAQYVDEASNWILQKGLQRQVSMFRSGFESVAPGALHMLSMFTPQEQQQLIAGDSDVLWEPSCRSELDPAIKCAPAPILVSRLNRKPTNNPFRVYLLASPNLARLLSNLQGNLQIEDPRPLVGGAPHVQQSD